MAEIGPIARLRASPYCEAKVKDGVTAFSPYSKMLMSVSYGDPDAEHDRLMNPASQWDVAVQRSVEVRGPDAARLVQIVSVRKL